MSENIAQNMYSSHGIINYPIQLHLVGHFCIMYHDARQHEYQGKKCWCGGNKLQHSNKEICYTVKASSEETIIHNYPVIKG
jgi:hypothetical protein